MWAEVLEGSRPPDEADEQTRTWLEQDWKRWVRKLFSHHVSDEDGIYRETYARASQPNLFGEPPEEGTILYRVLLHGPEEQNKTRPGFAHVAFPNKDCSDYVGRINLFGRFPELVSELWSFEEEMIPDELDMGIRPESERRKDDEEGTEDHTG